MTHIHQWSWPFTSKKRTYPAGYQSHQVCTDCGAERYYDFAQMQPGPLTTEFSKLGRRTQAWAVSN